MDLTGNSNNYTRVNTVSDSEYGYCRSTARRIEYSVGVPKSYILRNHKSAAHVIQKLIQTPPEVASLSSGAVVVVSRK